MTERSKYDEHALGERDVLLSARLIVVQFGREASARARERVVHMKAIGNLSGARAWRRILEAIIGIHAAAVK